MSAFEELFNSAELNVVAPTSSVGFPQTNSFSADDWFEKLEDESLDRKMAFFEEESLSATPPKPPIELLTFLAHLQISYDASYISSLPSVVTSTPESNLGPVPPRTISITRNKATTLAPNHPSIFPPSTPHPVPSTAASDRQYVQSQGTLLRAGIWGESTLDTAAPSTDTFALLWSSADKIWVAAYKMTVQVSFMSTMFSDPLLCLTVSTTLRDKPLSMAPARRRLGMLIEEAGGLPAAQEPTTPTKANGDDEEDDERRGFTGLEEVNLLEGLNLGSTIDDATSPLTLPSTRLGPSLRKEVYSLSPAPMNDATTPMSSKSTATVNRGSAFPTLRKSFRKTLRTVSGFRVRMRTVFVPFFMFPYTNGSGNGNSKKSMLNGNEKKNADEDADKDDGYESDDPDSIRDRELREAGNEEHTVVLCVEVDNAGESEIGFSVEKSEVTVGGEGARTKLIGWGETGLMEPERIFPIFIGPKEQYNLLYAVSFLKSPETDEFSLARGRGLPGGPVVQELQRAVTIIIHGRPFELAGPSETRVYPTTPFPSRWNCVLDLSPQATALADAGRPETIDIRINDALPTPASPFPPTAPPPAPRSAFLPTTRSSSPIPKRSLTPQGSRGSSTPTYSAIAGNKRYTLSAMDGDMRPPASPVNYRSSTAMLNPVNQRDLALSLSSPGTGTSTPTSSSSLPNPFLSATAPRTGILPPSLAFNQSYPKSPTTYGPGSPPLPPVPGGGRYGYSHGQEDSLSSEISIDMAVPPTPAYPAFSPASPLPQASPNWQGPIAGSGSAQSGQMGPSVEIRRERGYGAGGGIGVPPTPGPRIGAGVGFAQMQQMIGGEERTARPGIGKGEPIIVSIGILPMPKRKRKVKIVSEGGEEKEREVEIADFGKIYPLDRFTLDIFVYNQSTWTRRFEVSYPDRRTLRKEHTRGMLSGGIKIGEDSVSKKGACDTPGILPLENRVRVGPLLPSTCQSVRMDFLALTPGVHSIDTITLVDVQTGYTMNLRSVIDVVVHEHETVGPDHEGLEG